MAIKKRNTYKDSHGEWRMVFMQGVTLTHVVASGRVVSETYGDKGRETAILAGGLAEFEAEFASAVDA